MHSRISTSLLGSPPLPLEKILTKSSAFAHVGYHALAFSAWFRSNLQIATLLLKSPTLCCLTFSPLSLAIPSTSSSPYLSTSCWIQSFSRWDWGRGGFLVEEAVVEERMRAGIIPLPLPLLREVVFGFGVLVRLLWLWLWGIRDLNFGEEGMGFWRWGLVLVVVVVVVAWSVMSSSTCSSLFSSMSEADDDDDMMSTSGSFSGFLFRRFLSRGPSPAKPSPSTPSPSPSLSPLSRLSRITLVIVPVVGSRVTFTFVGFRILGFVIVGIARESVAEWEGKDGPSRRIEEEEGTVVVVVLLVLVLVLGLLRLVCFSTPPVGALSRDVRPRRR